LLNFQDKFLFPEDFIYLHLRANDTNTNHHKVAVLTTRSALFLYSFNDHHHLCQPCPGIELLFALQTQFCLLSGLMYPMEACDSFNDYD